MSSNTIYYVYQWLREDGTPYYIGKGKEGRAWRKGSPPKERIEIITEGLSEQAALALEVELIAKYGRKDLGTGILRNLTDGGDGMSGYTHTDITKANMRGRVLSESTRAKISTAMKGRTSNRKGVTLSEETKTKMRGPRQGDTKPRTRKPHSEETKQRMREAQRRRREAECPTST